MGFKLHKFSFKRQKMADKTFFLIRMFAVVMALALVPVPINISATEEQKASGRESGAEADSALQESEEPSAEEEPETTPETAPQESESQKETEPETSAEEEPETTSEEAPKESEPQKETEPETSAEKETETTSEEAPKESESRKETEPETSTEKETKAEPSDKTETGGKKEEGKDSRDILSNFTKLFRSKVPSAVEIKVPIYNYEVVNIVAPAKYAVALNPYELAVKTGEDEASTEQVVSRNYGILNKSSTDKIVSVTFTVEDMNDGKIVFVDSAEEAREAEKDTYAVYLAVVPADDSGIWVDGEDVDCDTTAADLSDVEMNGAVENAMPLGKGENTISFKLDRAVYRFEDGRELILEEEDSGFDGSLELSSLAPEEGGITAFTFAGAMNPKADWGKLLYGIKISAVYTYETATGEEEILEGTGAVVEQNQEDD